MGEISPPDRDALVALNRSATIARLMSGTVHEVNNALQVISGSVELLEQQPDLAPPVLRSLDRIKRQGERAAAALAELLVFSKASLDAATPIGLRQTVEQAIGLRRYAIARAGLSIELHVDDHGPGVVVANAGYVQQAVLNLIVNAEQAMTGSGGAIEVRLRDEPNRAGVEVTDHGPGLSDAAQSRLFEPFSSTRDAREGAGLGLWASRVIAESYGGSLEIATSTIGTTAVLWLERRSASAK